MVAAAVQPEGGAKPLVTVKAANCLGVFLHRLQHRALCPAFSAAHGKENTAWLTLELMGENILPEPGEPERAGNACRAGKHIRSIKGIQREQPRQGINASPFHPLVYILL